MRGFPSENLRVIDAAGFRWISWEAQMVAGTELNRRHKDFQPKSKTILSRKINNLPFTSCSKLLEKQLYKFSPQQLTGTVLAQLSFWHSTFGKSQLLVLLIWLLCAPSRKLYGTMQLAGGIATSV